MAPAASCLLALTLCGLTAFQCRQLWQYQQRQTAQLDRLELALVGTRQRARQLQADLERNFDPQQIPMLLREKYGWVDGRDRLIRLESPDQETPRATTTDG